MKIKTVFIVLSMLLAASVFAAVEVSYVSVRQIPGTKTVEINYDVSSDSSDTVDVSLEVKDGDTILPATTLTGDIGANIPTGQGKQILWDAGADWNGNVAENLFVQVIVENDMLSNVPEDFVRVLAGTTPSGGVTTDTTFYMSKFEITKNSWDIVATWAAKNGYDIGPDSGSGATSLHPVQSLSWFECLKWCNARSEKEGLIPCYYTDVSRTTVYRTGSVEVQRDGVDLLASGYRLPSGTEWEYAARGGSSGLNTAYSGSNNPDEVAWYRNNSNLHTHEVGQLAPNEIGIYDMSGNVMEWTWGPPGTYRSARGGSCFSYADYGFSLTYSANYWPHYSQSTTGFRPLMREISVFGIGTNVTSMSVDTRDYTLQVVSDKGSPIPAVGTHTYPWGSAITCSAGAQAGYSCTGWNGTGSIPETGVANTTGEYLLTDLASTITWLWEQAGDGTAANPYQISTRQHLEAVNSVLSAHYILMNDIDLEGVTYDKAVIAPYINSSSPRFTGTFDGRGFKIKNLTINGGSNDFIGLFGRIDSGGSVSNLGIINCDISGRIYVGGLCGDNTGSISSSYAIAAVSGNEYVGGLCGRIHGGTITSSYATGSVAGSSYYVGGLCGYNYFATITSSYATSLVSGENWVGGLCGYNYEGTITLSYATGGVSGSSSVGGLCGTNYSGATITSSYATGTASGGDAVGGLCGVNYGTINSSYATGAVSGEMGVGGFCGWNSGTITSSFWDKQTSGSTWSADGTGKTIAEMQDINTFLVAGWDFVGETGNGVEDIWYMEPGGYPRLNGVGADGSGVEIERLIVAARRRVSRTEFEYDVRVKIKNAGEAISSAEIRLVGYPANLQLISAEPVQADNLGKGAAAICSGLLTIRLDRTTPTDAAKITWHAIRQPQIGGESLQTLDSGLELSVFGAEGIGGAELLEIADTWLWEGLADVNGDGIVNYEDMGILSGINYELRIRN